MKLLNITLVLAILTFFSCKSKPKVIVEDTPSTDNSTAQTVNSNPTVLEAKTSPTDMHQVSAVEILQADRYTYLKVNENGELFWIATSKFEAKVGNKYFYRGGLLKTNFESQEYNRVFDKIFLVSEIIDAEAHPSTNVEANQTSAAMPVSAKDFNSVSGAIKLKDLFNNKEKYSGKVVTVVGKCVKANYGIMNKNWYHIQDGTKLGGKNCDFTITTTDNLPLGANVAFEGKVILNKDFGAGYKYDILLEDAKLK
ncbi:hypothetical protein EMA8858_01882 [Emticicia aquatica]|uniref:GW domain-containing protein n=1 Tax=Emticicia aquatica TaxID=1681835 RepID=A0ABN8ES59_9BACT|nr:GW dipeptide domain-containing protein [Emticicia aquatica]CAH0995755.1 hypothetical protein EMA8858_01882 [Emticicia aquatica]